MDADEFKEKSKKQNTILIQTVLTTLRFIFQRQKNMDDPVLRSCLFIDKLSMALESVIGAAQAAIEMEIDDGKLPQSTKKQIDELQRILREELDVLMAYCRMPSYSPDAPFGVQIVKDTTPRFKGNAFNNDGPSHI